MSNVVARSVSLQCMRLSALSLACSALVACGGGDSSPTITTGGSNTAPSGSYNSSTGQITSANSVTSFTPTALTSALTQNPSLSPLGAMFGTPRCGVDVRQVQYTTVGGAGESTTASTAVLVPTGDATCTGARPVVLYAHGTTLDKNYNMAALNDSSDAGYTESLMTAALYAAQGYIVVAPNYAGYAGSSLSYHPYLNRAQQSQDMLDGLKAARQHLVNTAATATDSGKLFITGYSQGGYVALATARLMQDKQLPVTAVAPMSGPYGVAAMGDMIFYGRVTVGATAFTPLLVNSYQHAYGNIVTNNMLNPMYSGADTLFPSATSFAQVVSSNRLPVSAMFQTGPTGNATIDSLPAVDSLYSYGFDASKYLVSNDYRAAYLSDAQANPDQLYPTRTNYGLTAVAPKNTLRQAFKTNDLREVFAPVNNVANSAPAMPILFCAGNRDMTVPYQPNTGAMGAIFAGLANHFAMSYASVDMDSGTVTSSGLSSAADNAVRTSAATEQQLFTGAFNPMLAASPAALQNYHGMLAPFCATTARAFFAQF